MRIETALILSTLLIVAILFLIRFDEKEPKPFQPIPELTFENTLLTEVDTNRTLGRAFGLKGVQEQEILHLESLRYWTERLESLVADKATFGDDVITLSGNVSFSQTNGYRYESQKAIYFQQSGLLEIPVAFTATMHDTTVQGEMLQYETQKREIDATHIYAVKDSVKQVQ